jgi:hypothetical protein
MALMLVLVSKGGLVEGHVEATTAEPVTQFCINEVLKDAFAQLEPLD